MPGRVTSFLRNPSGNIPHIKKSKNKSSAASSPASRSGQNSTDISDAEDEHNHRHHHLHHAVKMHDLADAMAKANKRLSLPFGGKKELQCSAMSVDWKLESPPIIFHGNAEESTGALLSGTMIVDVKEDSIELDSFNAALNIHVTHKRPFHKDCPDCANHYTELKSWAFVDHPTVIYRGRHVYPFSMLLEGHLPASMTTGLMSIAYEFKADAVVAPHSLPPHSPTNKVKFFKTLEVKRSLPVPDMPHHSVRLFPPTNIKSSAHYNTTIHPTGDNKITLKLDGLMSLNDKTQTLDIWKLKKVSWKLEEATKTIAPACERHAPLANQPTPAEGEEEQPKKGIPRSEVRLLGEKNLHEGWKSDYSGTDGTVDFEFDYAVNQRRSKGELKYACDTKTRDGTQTTHSLLIEMVVSKEFAPAGRPNHSAQTGTGRILRMQFNVVLTDHPGLGISWDEEAPPTYQDVPPSPPNYVEPGLIEYDDLETLDAMRTSSAPQSRRGSGSV